MEKTNARMKTLKRQIDQVGLLKHSWPLSCLPETVIFELSKLIDFSSKNYDEMSVVNTAKRKLQRELDEVMELRDALQRENNTLKQRQRWDPCFRHCSRESRRRIYIPTDEELSGKCGDETHDGFC